MTVRILHKKLEELIYEQPMQLFEYGNCPKCKEETKFNYEGSNYIEDYIGKYTPEQMALYTCVECKGTYTLKTIKKKGASKW